MLFKRHYYPFVVVSLSTLLLYACQPNKLPVKEGDTVEYSSSHTIKKSDDTMIPIQHLQKISPSDLIEEKPDAITQQEAAPEPAFSPSDTRKRPRSNDSTPIISVHKKAHSDSSLSHAAPQTLPSTALDSCSLLKLIVERREQDITEALGNKKRTSTTEDMNEEDFESFQTWFKVFAKEVDNEEALYKEEISKAISKLAEEGNGRGYLTKTLEINLHELAWNTDFTPLHYAAARGNDRAVKVLLKYVSVDIRNSETCTPLHFAAYAGYVTVAQSLIDQCKKESNAKAILNAKDDQGSSPMFYAAGGPRAHGNAQVIELLVENGVDITQTLDESTLIDIAASLGNVEVVKYCLTKMKEVVSQRGNSVVPIIESAMQLAKREKQHDTFVVLHDYLKNACK